MATVHIGNKCWNFFFQSTNSTFEAGLIINNTSLPDIYKPSFVDSSSNTNFTAFMDNYKGPVFSMDPTLTDSDICGCWTSPAPKPDSSGPVRRLSEAWRGYMRLPSGGPNF